MSKLEMKVPSPGESISEVEIATWLVSDGDYVEKDQAIAEVDSDKATLELPAEEAGTITLKAEEGDTIEVGAVCCLIDTSAKRPADQPVKAEPTPAPAPAPKAPAAPVAVAPTPVASKSHASSHPSPGARKMMSENGISAAQVPGTGRDGRILQQDVAAAMAAGFDSGAARNMGRES
jgi:2-oxoglutarate dehydrogenase E2 component (dihydrolipoamide succinyltransferase)